MLASTTSVSELRKSKYSPFAFFAPILFAFENPRFFLFWITVNFAHHRDGDFSISETVPSVDALSTITTSKLTSFKYKNIESRHFVMSAFVLYETKIIETIARDQGCN